MRKKAVILLILLYFTSINSAYASSLTITDLPSSNMETEVGSRFSLTYETEINGFTSSIFILSMNLSDTSLNYVDYSVKVDNIPQNNVDVQEDSGTLFVSSEASNPHNGTLIISVTLEASKASDNIIPWRYIVTGFDDPPNPPVFRDETGSTQVSVGLSDGLTVQGEAEYNSFNDFLNISARLQCPLCEDTSTSTVEYLVINDTSQLSTSITGTLDYNPELGEFQTSVEAPELVPGEHMVQIIAVDQGGHSGEKTISIVDVGQPQFTIETSGVETIQEISVKINQDTRLVEISDGNSYTFMLTSETNTVEMPGYIPTGGESRLLCNNPIVTITPESSSHIFRYYKEYKLKVETDYGVVKITPDSADDYYTEGAEVALEATGATNRQFDSWTGSGDGSYTGTENPTNITINGSIIMRANWSSIETNQSENGDDDYIGEATFHIQGFEVYPNSVNSGENITFRYRVKNGWYT